MKNIPLGVQGSIVSPILALEGSKSQCFLDAFLGRKGVKNIENLLTGRNPEPHFSGFFPDLG